MHSSRPVGVVPPELAVHRWIQLILPVTCLVARANRLVSHARLMQRNPRWDVEVSMGWGMRAAGR